jgi:hypothetical protein
VGLALVVRISPPEPTGRPISDTEHTDARGELVGDADLEPAVRAFAHPTD